MNKDNFKELKTYNEIEDFHKDKERVGFLSDVTILKEYLGLEYIWLIEVYKQADTNKDRYYYMFTFEDDSIYVCECTV